MSNPDDDLYDTVGNLLPEEKQPAFTDFRDRYFDFSDVFSRSEADNVALNEEFNSYYATVLKSRGQALPSMVASSQTGGCMTIGLYMSMGSESDWRSALAEVTAPVLVIHAEDDLQPEAASQRYVDAFPKSEFTTNDSSGHFPFVEQPDAFSRVVGAFFEQHVSGAASKN